jgi:hypothetical protein
MRRTMGIRLKGDPVRTIEVVGTRYLLNEGERSGLLRHLIEGGDLSAYGLVNAVTHFAQDVDDYDRATEVRGAGRQAARAIEGRMGHARGSGVNPGCAGPA